MDRAYGYDNVGNVSSITTQDGGYEASTYTYDHLDRLTHWTTNNGQYNTNDQSYSFDLVGNITSKNRGVYNYDYSHGPGGGGPYAVRNTLYDYDANGNMTNDPSRNYAWNVENQPTTINRWPVNEQYRYDGNGERVRREVNGGSSPGVTYYAGGMYEEDASGTRRVLYSLPGGGTAQRSLSGGADNLVYLHGDHLGSVSAATDGTGAVASRQQYDPWGSSYNVQGTSQTKVDYTGQKKDDTGLLYYHARYYDPIVGRFVSPDSIVPGASSGVGGAGGMVGAWQNSKLTVDFHEGGFLGSVKGENQLTLQKGFWFQLSGEDQGKVDPSGPSNPQALGRYSYVLNNPIRYTDPSGHYLLVIDGTTGAWSVTLSNKEIKWLAASSNIASILAAFLAAILGLVATVMAAPVPPLAPVVGAAVFLETFLLAGVSGVWLNSFVDNGKHLQIGCDGRGKCGWHDTSNAELAAGNWTDGDLDGQNVRCINDPTGKCRRGLAGGNQNCGACKPTPLPTIPAGGFSGEGPADPNNRRCPFRFCSR